jgi:hypothetical protein
MKVFKIHNFKGDIQKLEHEATQESLLVISNWSFVGIVSYKWIGFSYAFL